MHWAPFGCGITPVSVAPWVVMKPALASVVLAPVVVLVPVSVAAALVELAESVPELEEDEEEEAVSLAPVPSSPRQA